MNEEIMRQNKYKKTLHILLKDHHINLEAGKFEGGQKGYVEGI